MTTSGWSEQQARTLAGLLDSLIPPSDDGRLPGAGELALAAALDRALAPTPDARAAVTAGLASLDEAARQRGAASFAALTPIDRSSVAESVFETSPGLLPLLLFHAFAAYYQSPRVLEALGLEARPPHPLGYSLEPGDLASLERVRARGRLYREP